MTRESCVFYKSFYDSIKELELNDQARIYNAIFQYQFEGKEIELTGICKSIFLLIKPLLNANNQRYINGKKGGRPKKEKTETKPNENLKKTDNEPNQKVMYNELCIMNNELCNMNNDIKKENNKKKNYFENEELNNLFLEFLEVRKKKKAVNSERAINMLLKKLSTYDDETKTKMIEQSILNSWKDIYEVKEKQIKKYSDEWWEKI